MAKMFNVTDEENDEEAAAAPEAAAKQKDKMENESKWNEKQLRGIAIRIIPFPEHLAQSCKCNIH